MFKTYRQFAAWQRKQRMIQACNPRNWFIVAEREVFFVYHVPAWPTTPPIELLRKSRQVKPQQRPLRFRSV